MARSIDRGFYDQYMFRRPPNWPWIPSSMFRHSEKRNKTIGDTQCAPPRWLDLVSVLEQKQLLNVWIYRRHVEPLLRRFTITSKDAFETVWRERSELRQVKILRTKGGLVRFMSEFIGKPIGMGQGVLEFDSWATKLDALQLMNELNFSLGAHGATVQQYPVAGLNHRYAILDIPQESQFRDFLTRSNRERQEDRNLRTSSSLMKNPPPAWSATLHTDYWPLESVLPFEGVERTMAETFANSSPTRASALSVRDAKADEIQKKLNDLKKMLADMSTPPKSAV